jgi:MoaA/NifB/PqqE/SkfB family radical SAM enzyme
MESAKKSAAQTLFSGGLHLIPLIPDNTFLSMFERTINRINYPDGRVFFKQALLNAKRLISSPRTKKCAIKMIEYAANQMFDASEKRKKFKEKYGFRAPLVMVISPSMRCNLRCYGCYAGEYSQADDLDSALLERVICEAEDMGIVYTVVSGGEPFFSKDVLKMWEKHNNMLFQVYTNGTLIDQEMAQRLAEYGNVVPCISVEGYKEETDLRRGKGTYERILAAMDNLNEEGVIFGFSATATRQNNELISSDEFVDFYMNKGCFIGWYFNYVPIGRKPALELMPTPEQRVDRWKRIRRMRQEKPILLADFWCDGPLSGGCIAGGRSYFHVNNHGDVEPCVFTHFATDNLKDTSLADALGSPLFRAIRSRQPYCPNLLRPCMIIDNPTVLREVVSESNAHPTHPGAETIICELAEELDRYAAAYAELADEAWKQNFEMAETAEQRS